MRIRSKRSYLKRGLLLVLLFLKAIREKGNASDAFLKVVEPVPLAEVLDRIPHCKHIGTTGGKATEILLSLLPEKVKLPKTGETIPFVFNGRELTFKHDCHLHLVHIH